MSDFVRNDVGARKIAGRAEALRQLVEKSEVEVDVLVAGTIERSRRRAREAAGGLDLTTKQNQLRRLIAAAGLLEDFTPYILGIAEDRSHEILLLVAHGRGARANS